MSDAVQEGAVMPEGIEVDEAAAYFGVVETSDAVHQLMAMNRFEAMENFFAQLSDIVLTAGEFDFEAASERMQCEGGEIYFLVAGHLSLLNVTDPLLNYLGLENSLGQGAGNCQREATGADYDSLKELSDPMKILKLLAIAYTTGGKGEVTRYFNGFEALISNPGANESALLSISNELIISLDVAGHALPIPTLASGKAASAAVAIPAATVKPTLQTKQGIVPLQAPAHESIPLPSEGTIPLPSAESKVSVPVSVPIPVPVPVMVAEIEQAPVNNENLKEVAKATQDAFAGAFNIGVEEETAPVVEEETAPVVEEEIIPVAVPQEVVEEIQPEVVQVEQSIVTEVEEDKPQQDKFVSAAEHFIAADSDGSGQLSIEELAEATDSTIEEATALHAQADTDGDGSVSLSEFMSSAAGEKAASLPKPVAPVRKPLNDNVQPKVEQVTTPTPQPRPIQSNQQQQQEWNQQQQQLQQQQQQQQQWDQQQQQLQQQQQQQQQWNQQQQQQQQWNQQQQQGWNQPQTAVQPTIRSGVMCRGCGIGLDPNWKHCPICGSANAGY